MDSFLKAGGPSMRYWWRIRNTLRAVCAPCTGPNVRVLLILCVAALQLGLIRVLFKPRDSHVISFSDHSLQQWNSSCQLDTSAKLDAARRGEIVSIGESDVDGRYFIVPRVCVSRFAGGKPWLPAAALSDAGRAQLAALDPQSTSKLPSVLTRGRLGENAAHFELPIRSGSAEALAAEDNSSPVPIFGVTGESPALVTDRFEPGSAGHDPIQTTQDLAGSWLRLGGLLQQDKVLRPQLFMVGADSPWSDSGSGVSAALKSIFRLDARPYHTRTEPECFGPALIGSRGVCEAGKCPRRTGVADHKVARTVLLHGLAGVPVARESRDSHRLRILFVEQRDAMLPSLERALALVEEINVSACVGSCTFERVLNLLPSFCPSQSSAGCGSQGLRPAQRRKRLERRCLAALLQ